MAGEAAPSGGKTTAIASLGTAQGVGVLLYFCHKAGIDDMPPEVAASIIGFAGMAAGTIMHFFQRRKENAEANKANGQPVIGGPAAA